MEECRISLDGRSYRYLERPGEGAILLCLHGLGDSSDQFELIVRDLPRDWRVLALDQRGHGGSWRGGEDYSPHDFAGDAARFLDLLDLDRAHLFGHSMGGRNGLVLATTHPEKVGSLILGDIGPEKNLSDIEGTRRFFEGLPGSFPSGEEALDHWRRRKPGYSPECLDLLMRNMAGGPEGGLTWRFSRDACVAAVTAARSRDWWDLLPRVDCPVLLLHAESSTELSDEVAGRMRGELRDVRYARLPGCGHNFHMENPSSAATEIREFIAIIEAVR